MASTTEEEKNCNIQGRRGTLIHLDCYEEIGKVREECNNSETSSNNNEHRDEMGKMLMIKFAKGLLQERKGEEETHRREQGVRGGRKKKE